MLSSLLYLSWSYFPILYRFIYGGGRPTNGVINIPMISLSAILTDGFGKEF